MSGFETKASTLKEDLLRSTSLSRTTHQGEWGDRARELGVVLGKGDAKHIPRTGASSRYGRHNRERIIGCQGQLLAEGDDGPSATFTLIRKAWAFHPGELDQVDPRSIVRSLRKNICDLVGEGPQGWLCAHFECSYDPIHSCYQGHFHGLATGDYVAAVDQLRDRRGFRPWEEMIGLPGCNRPVQLKKIEAADIASQSGYSYKSFWKMRNSGKRIRLDGIEHTRSLLFLDKWRLEDLSLLIGIGVKDGRLFQTRIKRR